MAALSNITVQNKIDELASNSFIGSLTNAQFFQIINNVSQQIANLYNKKDADYYKQNNVGSDFGDAIDSAYTQSASGSVGFVCQKEHNTLGIDSIIGVQVLNTEEVPSIVSDFIVPTDISSLFGYINDANAPEVALSVAGNFTFVFINTGFAPYDPTVKCAVFYYRKVTAVTATSDLLDIPSEASNLLSLMCVKEAQTLNGVNPSRDIVQQINQELDKLELI